MLNSPECRGGKRMWLSFGELTHEALSVHTQLKFATVNTWHFKPIVRPHSRDWVFNVRSVWNLLRFKFCFNRTSIFVYSVSTAKVLPQARNYSYSISFQRVLSKESCPQAPHPYWYGMGWQNFSLLSHSILFWSAVSKLYFIRHSLWVDLEG